MRQVFPKRYTGRYAARSEVPPTPLSYTCGRMDLQLEAVPGIEPGCGELPVPCLAIWLHRPRL